MLVVAIAALVALSSVPAALGSTSGVVISEFRFRGPAGASDEFVELLNTSLAAVDVSGWKLQGCAATSGAASARATLAASTTLAPGQHFLLAPSSYTGSVAATSSTRRGSRTAAARAS